MGDLECWPPVGTDQVVDELVMSFTHDIAMNHLPPGVPPTGRRVRLAVWVVAGFRHGKLTHELRSSPSSPTLNAEDPVVSPSR